MPESDKKIKHFVFSRFFPSQSRVYLYNVLSPKFLEMQLPLAKNMLKSLENQTNKNFEVVFTMHPDFLDNPQYEFIFSTLKSFTSLPLRFIKIADVPGLIKDSYDNYDFVIETEMDFDDFIFKDAVADTQSKVNECDNILTYGYGKGYIYSKNAVYPFLPTERKYIIDKLGYFSPFFSVILKSSFAKTLPFIDVNTLPHSNVVPNLKKIFEKNNIEFPKDVYKINISSNAIIYFRHEFNLQISRGHANKVGSKKPLTDITKKQLEEEFGFFHELKSIE